MRQRKRWFAGVAGVACGLCFAVLAGCEEHKSVKVNGSSTVYPITALAAELFQEEHPDVRVTVGVSGTGGGFKVFNSTDASLRTDINDASRPIKPAEMETAKSLGIEFIEMPVALDGIAVVVNPGNDFCGQLTVEELKRIWEPQSAVDNWKDVRPGFPDLPLKLYGPGTDSGTFDYFTEVIVGKEKASRSDYTASEDDNVLVQGVEGDRGALGYFGLSYYAAQKDRLKVLGIDGGDGAPVKPSLETIRSGEYRPLSRPIFIYVNKASARRPEVAAFVKFYFEHALEVVEHPNVNYVSLPKELYPKILSRLENGVTGSAMAEAEKGRPADLAALFGGGAASTQEGG